MKVRTPPASGSIALPTDDAQKLFAPSAERNAPAIADLIRDIKPDTGTVLEIASGTGQHVVAFAAMTPELIWQPSEVAQDRIESIKSYVRDGPLTNINDPVLLNATHPGWGDVSQRMNLIVLSNLLHLISDEETETLFAEAALALSERGKFLVYGPFKRSGRLISAGDETFDASIRKHDPETGYKDDAWIKKIAAQAGLSFTMAKEMPAHNLALVFSRTP